MKRYIEIRNLDINEINQRVREDADSLIFEESRRYDAEVEKLARHLRTGSRPLHCAAVRPVVGGQDHDFHETDKLP